MLSLEDEALDTVLEIDDMSIQAFLNRFEKKLYKTKSYGTVQSDDICDLLQEKGPCNFAFSSSFPRFQLTLTAFQKFETKVSYRN